MTRHPRFFFVIFLSLFPLASLFAQTLSFPDILNLYHLDSSAARVFCDQKELPLTAAKNTGATKRYQFISTDSATRLEINYPNDSTSLNVQVSYWFAGAKEYSRFKEAFRQAGFTCKATKEVGGSLPSHAERYVGKSLQVELINPGGRQPYWLFLHPVGNYTW